MYELKVKDSFASAHFLRGYDGPCEKLHGHTWRVEVTIISGQLDSIGIVVDFKDVKKNLKEFLKKLDHVCLNEDVEFFKNNNPSTENMARYIYEEFSSICTGCKVKQVRVWESDNCSATYYE